MVVFYLRNSRNPDGKIVPVTIALTSDVLKAQNTPVRPDQFSTASGTDFPNLVDPEGDQQWILVAETTALDTVGSSIDPEIINVVTTGTVHQEIQNAMGRIAAQVDWGVLQDDTRPPKLIDFQPPLPQADNVPITSNIIARLQESLPSAGIDFDTVKVTVNGFDVTNAVEFKGSIFDLTLVYRPQRVLS